MASFDIAAKEFVCKRVLPHQHYGIRDNVITLFFLSKLLGEAREIFNWYQRNKENQIIKTLKHQGQNRNRKKRREEGNILKANRGSARDPQIVRDVWSRRIGASCSPKLPRPTTCRAADRVARVPVPVIRQRRRQPTRTHRLSFRPRAGG